MEFPQSDRNRVRRIPQRASYDRETIYAILDAGYVCHLGYVLDGQPLVIPTAYGRAGDEIYVHGSAASRTLKSLAEGIPVCLTVTHVDGLVLARSAFHHSMNYRSAVIFGTASALEGDEKERALFVISENILPGRWGEARRPNAKELQATSVLRIAVESASAKVRTGPPLDDEEDLALPIWAGVLPVRQRLGPAEADAGLRDGIGLPPSVSTLLTDG